MQSQNCPNVTFTVNGQLVVANASTEYKKGHCSDLRSGREVKVDGVKIGSVVTAKRIEIG